MRALEEPLGRMRPTLVQDTPLAALAALAIVGGVAFVTMSESVARIVGLAIAHGALLGTALTWTAGSGRRERWAPLEGALVLGAAGARLEAARVLGAAAGCASLHPVGALGYAVVPVWLAFRRPAWLGARGPRTAMAAAGGAVFGLLLGAPR